MRVLCALKFCSEVGEEEYSANAITRALASPAFTGGTKFVLVYLDLPHFLTSNPELNLFT
jgi:hypothetical protein